MAGSLNPLDYPARYQWRQPYAPCGGSSCCTDTCIQMIINFYQNRLVSLRSIRWAAQRLTNYNEYPCSGINAQETMNALRYYGIGHYRVASNIDSSFVLKKLAIGPVLVGVHYGTYPKNKNGRCGYTNRAHVSGKTDCPFRGAHAVLALRKRYHVLQPKSHTDVIVRDPNHYSYNRPERPAYDVITMGQLDRAMKALPLYTNWRYTYALYPTLKKR